MKYFKYLVFIALFFYGLFYHISSSEFWPITISKTWWHWPNFEYSILQKPLLTLFLSLFHLLPLNNVQHLYLVKACFSLLGVLTFYFYGKLLLLLSKNSKENEVLSWLLLFILSPILLHNFFRVRTDQIALLFFILFLISCHNSKLKSSLFYLLLIPLLGIKEILFLLPGIYIFYLHFKNSLTTKIKIYTGLASLTVVTWAVALNLSSLTYLIETFKSQSFPNSQLTDYLKIEGILLIFSFFCAIYFIIKPKTQFKAYSFVSIFCLTLILVMPQSYAYYIASLASLVYLPFFLFLLNLDTKYLKYFLILPCLISVIYFKQFYHSPNSQQFEYIRRISKILKRNNFSYLDGMGILPRQKFVPCFISPDDDKSNNHCLEKIINAEPDIVIMTNRLYLYQYEIFPKLEGKYAQVLINTWVRKNLVSKYIETNEINLEGGVIPMFIFGFN